MLYTITCLPCAARNIRSIYIGETSRSAYEGGEEHNQGSLNDSEASALNKHGWETHALPKGSTPQFSMTIVRSFRGALQQQVAQAVAILTADVHHLLNSKAEWGFPQIP